MSFESALMFAGIGLLLVAMLRVIMREIRKVDEHLRKTDSWLLIRAKKLDKRFDDWMGEVDQIVEESG